ncbi:MAG TPA: VOC family protein [Acidothermaceae bacterium]|jgi:lactoylglutathione lyase|nr:VOC family protein [Acidothermaceae bacterium]
MTEHPVTDGHVTGFWHVGITVRDMAATLEFYCDGLGFEVVSTSVTTSTAATVWVLPGARANTVFLKVPNSDVTLELFEFTSVVDQRSVAARPWDFAHGHFALFVDDLDGLYKRLQERGYRGRADAVAVLADGPLAGAKAIYMIDPDGYHVELFERPS